MPSPVMSLLLANFAYSSLNSYHLEKMENHTDISEAL